MALLQPGQVFGLLRELRGSATHAPPVQVDGILAEQLVRELGAGGEPGAVRAGGDPAHASVLVVVLAGPPSAEDERLLRAANRARTPIVAVQTGRDATLDVPYVLATDVVACPPGAGFPVDEIAERLAVRLGESATGVAARLPVVREHVTAHLTESFARRNGVLAVAIFIPGADFPVLTLNQIRLVLRIAAAHGQPIDVQRTPEVLAVIGGALGFRAVARQLVGFVPFAGWALQGGIAYGATKAIGEAASQRFARAGRGS